MKFSNITLLNNKFNNFSMVYFPSEKNACISFKEIVIQNCEFNNSFLIQSNIINNYIDSV